MYTLKESWEDSKVAWNAPLFFFFPENIKPPWSVPGVGDTEGKGTKVRMSLVRVVTQGGHKQIDVLRVGLMFWLTMDAR